MSATIRRRTFEWLLAALLLVFSSAGHAQIVQLGAELTASAQVPSNSSSATGKGEFQFDAQTNQLIFTVVYGGLTGPAVAAHIHGPARPGTNARIVVPFPVPQSPISGTARLTEAQAAALLDGQLYVNIHTNNYPQGEIRGQITK